MFPVCALLFLIAVFGVSAMYHLIGNCVHDYLCTVDIIYLLSSQVFSIFQILNFTYRLTEFNHDIEFKKINFHSVKFVNKSGHCPRYNLDVSLFLNLNFFLFSP